ncbi:hypothetical protein [Sinorhizobium sp. BG8]|uniref:hypothetical protein n=1 Tax=Sinorhizobium sp. BG8 TaxID=2613773 RepID=UPI00193DB5E0|nr:hypothetical protein [Sinorhizobium sp. BG8]QRM56450.1 hypothetical protein F3Y30_19340 [Sinorhizobium sp. BG8]
MTTPAIGLSLGGHAISDASVIRNIAAWGDSLTAGAGASTALTSYPARASLLFAPARDIANCGVGGQDAEQIAARQGGVPITVTVENNSIPERRGHDWSWNFADGEAQGWRDTVLAGPALVTGGWISCSATNVLDGLYRPLEVTLPAGLDIRIAFDIVISAGMTVCVNGLGGGAWGAKTPDGAYGHNLSSSGHYSVALVSGGAIADYVDQIGFLLLSGSGTFSVDNIVVSVAAAEVQLSVTDRSPNVLTVDNGFTGMLSGTLAGVRGTMTTDASGNWTFLRESEGAAVACPVGTRFIPEEARSLRNRIAWFWAGNNGIADADSSAAGLAAIEAMIAHLPHRRFLVAPALAASDASPALMAVISDFNASLASLYGTRFVDLLVELQASGNHSADDDADIAAGHVPRSLRVDSIHLNDVGYAVVAGAMKARTLALGW